MLGVALGLRPAHFGFFRTAPKVFLAGLVGQLLGLPLLTLGLCFWFQPMPSVALGMILIACCPGGNVSNLLVLLSRGDIALSVSLTAASSLSAAFITPIMIVFWSGLYPPTASLLDSLSFDAVAFLIQTAALLALPLIVGMIIAGVWPKLANRLRGPLVTLGGTGLLGIIILGSVQYLDEFWAIGGALIGIVAVHNAAAFLLGNIVARLAQADTAARRAITFEVGIQNSGLGIVILLTQLGGLGGAAAVAGLWGTWHLIAGLALVLFFRTADRVS
ncbi:BASS family bile acid:Na+ symporter [Arenicella xantha]|uniref:BASS family bile acid:Na+ symporter n=2 Tax=Arenicella xantha TaxID=644221 RepID=A0A395JTC2_9GAMM|nr:BASS family bile acid:Na+ symporter [Arenicella xantha]